MSRNDHSYVEDWTPAALQETLNVLNNGLQEASVVIIVVVIVLVVPTTTLAFGLLTYLTILGNR